MTDNIALKKLRVLFASLLLAVAPVIPIAAQVAGDGVVPTDEAEFIGDVAETEGLSSDTGSAWRFSWGPKAAFHLSFPGALISSARYEEYECGY